MKKIFLGAVCFLLLGACKKDTGKKVTIVKDCTGSYLRSEGKDYHICNIDKVAHLADGATATVSYKKIEKCTSETDKMVCMMYHENEGWVEVLGVK